MSAKLDNFLSRLDRVTKGSAPGSYRAICPAHDSKHRSLTLSVSEGDDGRVLMHCFAGCDVHAITAAVGLELSDLYPPRTSEGKPSRTPFSAMDALVCLAFEGELVKRGALATIEGRALNDADFERLCVAVERISEAVNVVKPTLHPPRYREAA